MRQRSSQIVFLLLLLCALPYGEAHASTIVRTITGSDSFKHGTGASQQSDASHLIPGAASQPTPCQSDLPPATSFYLSAPRPVSPPAAQAAALASHTSLRRA